MRKRKQQTFDDIIRKWKKDYMSILFLTIHFQDKEKGLRLLHYRYALVKNDNISDEWRQEMKAFFEWKLNQLYRLNEIQKCISSRQNLVRKLHNFINWQVLEKLPPTKDRDYPLYQINKDNYYRIDLTLRKNRLKNLFNENINQLPEERIAMIEHKIEDFLGIQKPEQLE